jgi:hypothetical protein
MHGSRKGIFYLDLQFNYSISQMKKIYSIFWALMLVSAAAFAQSTFQGTLKYGFNFMGEGIDAYQAMLPTGMEIAVLKSDVHVEVKGGMAAMAMGRTLSKTKTGVSYMIKDSEETIYVMDPSKKKDEDPAESSDPQVTKEDETITIAGHECQKYKVVSNTPQGESTAYVWTTDKFKLPKSENAAKGGGMTGLLDMKGVPGMPMKVMTTQMGMTVTITAEEIDTKAPDKKLFKLPKGYAKEDFDMDKMMQGGM